MTAAPERLRAVALRTVRYNDRTNILTAWSDGLGRISVALNAGQGAESRRRRALTMPLSLFECSTSARPGREILTVRDMRPLYVPARIHKQPMRAAVAMFMADVLGAVLRDSGMPDAIVWQWIEFTVKTLDTASDTVVARLPLWFMTRLAVLSGIAPDTATYLPGYQLDLPSGVFRPSVAISPSSSGPKRFLSSEASELVVAMLRATTPRHLAAPGLRAANHPDALQVALDYFTAHSIPLTHLRTPAILSLL